MPDQIRDFVEQNERPFLEELVQYLRIPSVSSVPGYREDVQRAAQFVADQLARIHLEHVEIVPAERHPLIYADWLHAPNKPTVLCYGHYDVQPPDPLDEWVSDPFEPEIRNDNIYARGAADNKGQMYIHLKAVETLWETAGTLPLNVKFLIEGEEEIGGASISRYLADHRQKLAADISLISDTAPYAASLPTLVTGLRGLVYAEVHAKGASHDLHSGIYGGAAPNPIFGLLELLSSMKGSNGEIAIPGMYDDVRAPSSEELHSWASLDQKALITHEMGADAVGETAYPVLHRLWARPSFDAHGIRGGFVGEGAKTVIPAQATAKCSFRLVPNQDPEKIVAAFRAFVTSNAPRGVQMDVRVLSAGRPWSVDVRSRAIQAARAALSQAFGREPALVRSGASIPIVVDIARTLGIPAVIMGFADPDDGLHAPNEKFNLRNYYTGITAVAMFLDLYSRTT